MLLKEFSLHTNREVMMSETNEKKWMPRGTRKVSQEKLEQIRKMAAAGQSYSFIAKKFKMSRSTVYNYLSGRAVPYSEEEQQLLNK